MVQMALIAAIPLAKTREATPPSSARQILFQPGAGRIGDASVFVSFVLAEFLLDRWRSDRWGRILRRSRRPDTGQHGWLAAKPGCSISLLSQWLLSVFSVDFRFFDFPVLSLMDC